MIWRGKSCGIVAWLRQASKAFLKAVVGTNLFSLFTSLMLGRIMKI
jgi:hypothetical protein